jgi:chromosome segregation ATPase
LPIEHIIWPLLHALIGIGNQLLNFVIDYAEEYIQCLSNKERLLRDRVRQLERAVAVAREGIERWNKEGKQYKKYLTDYERGKITDANELAKYNEVKQGWEMAELERMSLEEEIAEYLETVSSGTKKISNNNKVLKGYRKERKTDADSLYTKIDDLLEQHGVCRAAYHGGDLQGNDVIQLMKSAPAVVDKFKGRAVNKVR